MSTHPKWTLRMLCMLMQLHAQVAFLGAKFQPLNCLPSRTYGPRRPHVGLLPQIFSRYFLSFLCVILFFAYSCTIFMLNKYTIQQFLSKLPNCNKYRSHTQVLLDRYLPGVRCLHSECSQSTVTKQTTNIGYSSVHLTDFNNLWNSQNYLKTIFTTALELWNTNNIKVKK